MSKKRIYTMKINDISMINNFEWFYVPTKFHQRKKIPVFSFLKKQANHWTCEKNIYTRIDKSHRHVSVAFLKITIRALVNVVVVVVGFFENSRDNLFMRSTSVRTNRRRKKYTRLDLGLAIFFVAIYLRQWNVFFFFSKSSSNWVQWDFSKFRNCDN